MSKPIRVQRQRTKGWRMPENTVYVGRPTKWGNPYHVELVGGNREHVCVLFWRYLKETPIGSDLAAEAKRQLRGKDLACWCPLDQPCHADVLLEIANAR